LAITGLAIFRSDGVIGAGMPIDSLLWIKSGILDELFKRFFASRSG
jgi:hypothetical protein